MLADGEKPAKLLKEGKKKGSEFESENLLKQKILTKESK